MLDGHGLEATIDDEFGPGEETAGIVGGEEKGCANEFLRVSEARGRSVAEDFGDPDFVEYAAILFGGEESWDESIDADIAVGPFASKIAGEIVDGGF